MKGILQRAQNGKKDSYSNFHYNIWWRARFTNDQTKLWYSTYTRRERKNTNSISWESILSRVVCPYPHRCGVDCSQSFGIVYVLECELLSQLYSQRCLKCCRALCEFLSQVLSPLVLAAVCVRLDLEVCGSELSLQIMSTNEHEQTEYIV